MKISLSNLEEAMKNPRTFLRAQKNLQLTFGTVATWCSGASHLHTMLKTISGSPKRFLKLG